MIRIGGWSKWKPIRGGRFGLGARSDRSGPVETPRVESNGPITKRRLAAVAIPGTISDESKSFAFHPQDRAFPRGGVMRALFRWHVGLAFVLCVTGGCGSPALFEARTVVHPDGSCDRTIWQPEGEMLPADALKPTWKV